MTTVRGKPAPKRPARRIVDAGRAALPATAPVQDVVARNAPEVVRYAAGAWLRAAGWAVGTSFRAASRLVRAASEGEPPAELLESARLELREYTRQLLGVADLEARLWRVIAPEAGMVGNGVAPDALLIEEGTAEALRERGAELLRRSADVSFVEDAHPAYARILGELAPDEARILRFMAAEGPQPAVDVRTSRPLNVATQMLQPGLSMIGVQAGCRHLDRVPAYLNNLYRLGLIWFSREPVEDTHRYQVLEVQPDVMAAKHKAKRSTTIRRSILLTPFGIDFCRMCLPTDDRG